MNLDGNQLRHAKERPVEAAPRERERERWERALLFSQDQRGKLTESAEYADIAPEAQLWNEPLFSCGTVVEDDDQKSPPLTAAEVDASEHLVPVYWKQVQSRVTEMG